MYGAYKGVESIQRGRRLRNVWSIQRGRGLSSYYQRIYESGGETEFVDSKRKVGLLRIATIDLTIHHMARQILVF